jgi:hypothetical protein
MLIIQGKDGVQMERSVLMHIRMPNRNIGSTPCKYMVIDEGLQYLICKLEVGANLGILCKNSQDI